MRRNLPSGERKRKPELKEQGFVKVDVESELPNGDQMGGVRVSCGRWKTEKRDESAQRDSEYLQKKLVEVTCRCLCRSQQMLFK